MVNIFTKEGSQGRSLQSILSIPDIPNGGYQRVMSRKKIDKNVVYQHALAAEIMVYAQSYCMSNLSIGLAHVMH